MSLILDALNKADHERNKESPPTINSAHDEPPVYSASPEKQHKLLFIGLIICMVVILALGAILVLDKKDTSNSESFPIADADQTAKGNQRQSGPAEKPQPQNQTRNASSANPTEATKPAATATPNTTPNPQQSKYAENRKKMIAAQYEQVNQTRKTVETTPVPASSQAPEAEHAKKQQEVAAIYKNQVKPTPQPQQVRATPRPTVAPRPTQPPANKNTLAGHPDIGTVHDLPFATQKQLPTLMYREHHYPNNVMLNKKVVSKGQQIEPNLYLEEILVDGIILRYEKRKFKMPRLNSWVNM
ncbi:hypothetical protein TDB9533_02391 [Thalassocella blandensis]|nr:hypothetical protein TDB9533_02391 [Thalassocella blandensis]